MSLNEAIRDYERKIKSLESECDRLKAEVETLKSTMPRGLYESRDAWKAKAEKLAEALRRAMLRLGPGEGVWSDDSIKALFARLEAAEKALEFDLGDDPPDCHCLWCGHIKAWRKSKGTV